jgi:hypothetical protein
VADKIDDSCNSISDISGPKLPQRAAEKTLKDAVMFYLLETISGN